MPTKPPPSRTAATPPRPVVSPFCGELRSKKFFMLNTMPTEAAHYLDDSDHCWCYVTQQVVGPDGDKVDPQRCTPGRNCYRSALADDE